MHQTAVTHIDMESTETNKPAMDSIASKISLVEAAVSMVTAA